MWLLPRFWFFRMLVWKLRGGHKVTTREVELRVQLEHAARRPQRLGLPDHDRFAASAVVLLCCVGVVAGIVALSMVISTVMR